MLVAAFNIMKSLLLLSSVLLPKALGALHESLTSIPRGWVQSRQQINVDSTVRLHVALQFQNLDTLESKLRSVSDPSSNEYGKYLSADNIRSIFSASNDSVDRVRQWLDKSGAVIESVDNSTVTFRTTVGQANDMLNTRFYLYESQDDVLLRTTQYSIPDHLSKDIDIIHPTTYFRTHKYSSSAAANAAANSFAQISNADLPEACKAVIYIPSAIHVLTPDCARFIYNIGDYNPSASHGSTIAYSSFASDAANQTDLTEYLQKLHLPHKEFRILDNIDDGKEHPNATIYQEGNIDAQVIAGLTGNLPLGEYVVGGQARTIPDVQYRSGNEPWVEYYSFLLSQSDTDLPYVISNSYGDNEDTVPFKYAQRACHLTAMLGMRGRTIIHSSGDQGVGSACRANTGDMEVEFTPQFPATCPFVTGLGGTISLKPEKAWFASSGGFSNYFLTAWYQKAAVQTYLTDGLSKQAKTRYATNHYANFSGRGFPDLAAHSDEPGYFTIQGFGAPFPSAGTSAAAPLVASVVALLNDARFRRGKPAMGFINPWLYTPAVQETFNDIVAGGSVGCQGFDEQTGVKIKGAGIIPFASWNATVGWDPVTGLGTPDFKKLLTIALG